MRTVIMRFYYITAVIGVTNDGASTDVLNREINDALERLGQLGILQVAEVSEEDARRLHAEIRNRDPGFRPPSGGNA